MTTDPVALLFAVAEHHPDQPAVDHGDAAISYAAFAQRTRELAGGIVALTKRDDERRVLIRLPRRADAYASMFATLHAGGYYSPANLDHPIAAQQRQIDRFEPTLVIGARDEIAEAGLRVDAPILDPSDEIAAPLDVSEPPHDLAYVMFTSGSTGEPKGVMVGRAALAHYTAWSGDAIAAGPGDRWSQHPNLGFDLSVLDIYGALCSGATLVPITDRRERLVPAIAVRNRRLTIWNSVPSVIDLMRRGGKMTPENLATLRLLTFCGEPLLPDHLDAIFTARPDVVVFNTYGPTEATVSMTQLRLSSGAYRDRCAANVAIGDPIPGMHILLEDGPSPREGEIVIAGPQVARGYWRDPALTADRFTTREVDGVRLPAYKTGDWVAWDGDNLFFASRIDRQIKINGYRLELAAVEAALREAGAAAASVVFSEGRLVAFVETDGSVDALREASAARLPSYAVPSEIRALDKLPRNANDKIDAGALMDLLGSS